ncbi:recombinase family protein [Candidatus Microgenomates bacterium]|nr:MAG: recombinase family protein [Candidatus Microgenomates bacterium]
MEVDQPMQYCLYARKSSEDDERQAMSIDSQIKEMTDLASREGFIIKEIRRESHSAKESGQRPVFKKLLEDIRDGMFTGILSWAPDRLSRNAGDLGMVVDLMDQGRLQQIKTFSQSFSNNPNEKFLLMILCSQAKLENDQKGINVKRGIRAKCEMGWRPGMPPIGYYNRAFAGVKDIIVDQDRGYIVTEMFERVVKNGDSGRTLKKWLDTCLTTRGGKKVTLSQIYLMLKNPFYYGEFEYPVGSGNWYKGKHEHLISKDVYNKVQQKLVVPKKSKWGSKFFIYKGILKCASCKSTVVAEERFRKRKYGKPPRRHIYYHCSRQKNYDCSEPYATEDGLEKSLIRFIDFVYINHPDKISFTEKLHTSMQIYKEFRDEVLIQQNISPNSKVWDIRDYTRYAIRYGKPEMKRELFKMFDYDFYLKNKQITTLRAH